MPDFEQKIQHCYHNQFFVTKDMGKNNFHRSCLERINLSWSVTTLSSAKTKHLLGILICRHFDAVCFYGAHSFSRGNHASDLKHAQSFCRCVPICWKAEVLLFETIGQRSDVMKSKMAARGKFKSRNVFPLLLLLDVTFPLSSKICNLGIICSNIASTCANSRGSL